VPEYDIAIRTVNVFGELYGLHAVPKTASLV
jgi:hypothetical protein